VSEIQETTEGREFLICIYRSLQTLGLGCWIFLYKTFP